MSDIKIEQLGVNKSFGGWTKMFSHPSAICGGEMKFSVFLPPQAESGTVPVLYWLSGLTCNHENFISKAGAQQYAAQAGIMLVAPDTSPRGAEVEGEDEAYDLGTGAGFYINATAENGKNTTVWRITSFMSYRKLSAQIFRLWKDVKVFSDTQWVVTEH